jgi:sugar phosphate isomerase/epimerase
MQIGAMNHPSRNPIEEIEWFGQNGFDFVDFTLEPPAADPDHIDVDAILGALERHNLGVVAHTAYYLPVASPFSSLRQVCLEEFKRALQAAHRLGAKVMTIHFHKPPKFFTEKETVQWHVEVLRPLCNEASQVGVTVVLEPIPFGGSNQLEMIAAILGEVPLLQLHLDSGHAKLERSYDRWGEYLEQLCHKLLHVHLSDNDGTEDQHLPLASAPRSKTNWPEHIGKLKSSGYDGTITLEVFSPEQEYLLLSRDLLRRWWDEAV